MSQLFSFDIIGTINLQEVSNAVNQANKEISSRYDFKNSRSNINLNQKENQIKMLSDDENKLKSVLDILQSKLFKRKISLKALTYNKIEKATEGLIRQFISIQSEINETKCKEIVKVIRTSKVKVQSQIQKGQIRVSSRKKNDLQEIITFLKNHDFGIHFEFANYR